MRGVLALAALLAAGVPGVAQAAGEDDRYALVHGCYDLAGPGAPAGGPFRMQATALGHYLLYTKDRRYLAAGGTLAAEPSPAADFEVTGTNAQGFVLDPREGEPLPGRFAMRPAEGCADFPEVADTSTGTPARGAVPYGETRGTMDAHSHLLAFEFLGGRAHCGRPWHPYGVAYALPDCTLDPSHQVLSNAVGRPGAVDLRGWPAFPTWPSYDALAQEGVYWKWLERSWKAGLRAFTALFVENEALCNIYPVKQNPCDDMASVRLQRRRIFELQDYIDAQYGGPGKGFFRIVTDPFEARRVINDGRLAVVMGIEVSRLFGCGVRNGVSECDKDDVDRGLEEVHRLGIRQMEVINKFDNAFGGVAGDAGSTGALVGAANVLTTGRFWDMRTCDEADQHVHDRDQTTTGTPAQDTLFGAVAALGVPGGTLPLYPSGPHCNQLGLSDIGRYLTERMIDRGMLIDPDHLGVYARRAMLDTIEARGYRGTISSHTWSTPDAELRILRSGGFVTPYAGDSTGFVKKWRELRFMRDARWRTGLGYGADNNGLGTQGAPRPDAERNPVRYPFRGLDGAVTFDRQVSGQRTFDINREGVAHYGLYADWFEDLRLLGGQEIADDMLRGAESYLETWERATGISPETCREGRLRLTRSGMGQLRLGVEAEELLRGAGQPTSRAGRGWTWCVQGRGNGRARARVAFSPDGRVGLVGSTVARHRIAGVGPGMRVPAGARRSGVAGVRRQGRFAFGVTRRGRIRWVAVGTARAVASPRALRDHLRTAGLLAR
jgi:hypothetical protein